MKWYERSFGPDYLALYPHRDDQEAARDIEQILALIAPSMDEPLLDLGCGAGRHLLALWHRGFRRLTGVDLSDALLEAASDRFRAAGAEGIELVRADMREIPFRADYGTILSMFTSFGYFETSEEDARMLRAVLDALRPGGVFLLDTMNRHWTIVHLVPEESRVVGDLQLAIHRSITDDGRRVEKETRVSGPEREPCIYRESVRMYTPDEVRQLLLDAGFTSIELYGSLDGTPLAGHSRRTIVVGRKPIR